MTDRLHHSLLPFPESLFTFNQNSFQRDILRLETGLSYRQINASTKVSVGLIQKLMTQAEELGLIWPLPPELDDNQPADLFYPQADTRTSPATRLSTDPPSIRCSRVSISNEPWVTRRTGVVRSARMCWNEAIPSS
jgi:hypothetical protein